MRLAYGEEAGCPPPVAFLEAEQKGAGRESRQRLEAHAGRCPACAAERDLAGAFDAGPAPQEDLDYVVSRLERMHPERTSSHPTSSKVLPLRPTERRSRLLTAWRFAAAAAVLLGVGWVLMGQRPPDVPSGEGQGVEVRGGGEVEILSPVGDLEALPGELRWVARPEASVYHVRLLGVEGTTLWEATVPGASTPIPEEISRRMRRAVVYFWEVEALDSEDNMVARSRLTRFRALPEGEDGEAAGADWRTP